MPRKFFFIRYQKKSKEQLNERRAGLSSLTVEFEVWKKECVKSSFSIVIKCQDVLIVTIGRHWLIQDSTGSVEGGTGSTW